MKLILSFKVLTGELYIQILLKKIQMARILFIAKLEQGLEVMIPHELSQDQLPISFRFYDPILQIANEDCREVVRCEFNIKNKLNANRLNNENIKFRSM